MCVCARVRVCVRACVYTWYNAWGYSRHEAFLPRDGSYLEFLNAPYLLPDILASTLPSLLGLSRSLFHLRNK